MSAVVRHVIDSISPASTAFADAARRPIVAAGAPILEQLAARLGGAQHTARPHVERRTLLVCAGDHGAGDPGIAMGSSHPTVIAAAAIALGSAALADVARAGRARIVIVDAGAVEAAAMPATVVKLGRGPTRNLLREPAMTVVDAMLGLEAGIALAMSLAEAGLDVLAVGAIGVGSELAAAALLGAAAVIVERERKDAKTQRSEEGSGSELVLSRDPEVETASGHDPIEGGTSRSTEPTGSVQPGTVAGSDPDVAAAFALGRGSAGMGALEILAAYGGPETAVLAGVMLGAASIHTPVILDGQATGAAALIAAALAPDVVGYLIAAHAGTGVHAQILAVLGLEPVFAVGLGHGEGIGAAMVLPLIDQVSALAASAPPR